MKYASFGTVSSGTMRTEDLLGSLSAELDYQIKRQPRSFKRRELRKLINEADRVRLWVIDPNDEGSAIVEELFDALEQFAPPYAYFGAHPGDGADYGYWLVEDIQECFDGLTVDDTSEVPADYKGEVLHVNDHGNMTLYMANGRGKLTEIWGLV